MAHPEAMPRTYSALAHSGPTHRVVCDYIAGMTDHFLLRQHEELLGSKRAHFAG
jgi:dGTP triphosphohydrolase